MAANVEYEVVTGKTEYQLKRKVNELLNDGYELHAGVSCSLSENDDYRYCLFSQAVVRRRKRTVTGKGNRMKLHSKTPEGEYVVQMSQEEYSALAHLAHAVEGAELHDIRINPDHAIKFGCDLSTVLGTICAFSASMMIVNELKGLTDAMVETLRKKLDQPPDEPPAALSPPLEDFWLKY